jgi:DeoR/GlpR family transcriptional regulator of sugar metabolism
MARPNTYSERKSAVRRIITAAKERGRITTRQAVEILGLHLNTVEKYFRDAERSGEVIRHGKCGLFRDYRATIDFDMERFSRQYGKGKQ